jgi:hypothetical protein
MNFDGRNRCTTFLSGKREKRPKGGSIRERLRTRMIPYILADGEVRPSTIRSYCRMQLHINTTGIAMMGSHAGVKHHYREQRNQIVIE